MHRPAHNGHVMPSIALTSTIGGPGIRLLLWQTCETLTAFWSLVCQAPRPSAGLL